MDKVKVRASSKIYENAEVKWTLEGDGNSTNLDGSGKLMKLELDLDPKVYFFPSTKLL